MLSREDNSSRVHSQRADAVIGGNTGRLDDRKCTNRRH